MIPWRKVLIGLILFSSSTLAWAASGTRSSNGLYIDSSGNVYISAAVGTAYSLTNGLSIDSNGNLLVNCAGCSSGSGTVTSVTGTANQIDVATGTSTPVLSLDSAITLPGTINNYTLTAPATGATLTIANGKTLTVDNSLTLAGTASSTLNIGGGGTLGTFATQNSATPPAISGTTPAAGTFTTPNSQNIESALYADQYTGVDMGAHVNAAIAALPTAGGVVVIPAGVFTFSTTINITRSHISIVGQGGGSLVNVAGTSLKWTGGASPLITMTNVWDVRLQGFNLDNTGTATIGVNIVSNSSTEVTNVVLDDVSEAAPATPFSSRGISITGGSTTPSTWVTLRKCWVFTAAPVGLYVDASNFIDVDNSTFMNNTNYNIEVASPTNFSSSFYLHDSDLQYTGAGSSTGINIYINNTQNATIRDNYMEAYLAGQYSVSVGANVRGIEIDGNYMSGGSGEDYAILVGANPYSVSIHDNTFAALVTAGLSSSATQLSVYQNTVDFSTPTVITGGQTLLANSVANNNQTVQGMSYPSVTITQGGTGGSASYTYVVVGTDSASQTRALTGTTATGNATLSSGNYNIITVAAFSSSSPYVAPASSCTVYRTVGGSTQGSIGTIASCASGGSLQDKALAATAGSPPTDTSGIFTAAGPANFPNGITGGPLTSFGSISLTNTTNQIVTGASSNLTTLNFPASSGAVTLTFPVTTEYMVGANSDTTTSDVLHATSVPGVFNSAAIAASDLTSALTTPPAIGGTTAAAGSFTTLLATNVSGSQASGISSPGVTLTQGGTAGKTPYEYCVVGTDTNSHTRSLCGATSLGNATLSSSNYNIVTVGAFSSSGNYILPVGACTVYRTVGGSAQGSIGTISSCSSGGYLNDTGLSATAGSPATDTSGLITGFTQNPMMIGKSTANSGFAIPSIYAESQFALETFGNTAHTSTDSVAQFGYNITNAGNQAVASEPSLIDGWESNWNISSVPWMERYIRFWPANYSGSGYLEPFYTQYNRNTGAVGTTYLRGTDVEFENAATLNEYLDCNATGCTMQNGLHEANGYLNIDSGYTYELNTVNVISAVTANNTYFFGPAGNLSESGTNNVGVGKNVLLSLTSGSYNAGLGYATLYSNTSGSGNTAFGDAAMQYNQAGADNVAIGYLAGFGASAGTSDLGDETLIGYQAGKVLLTAGSGNTLIGYDSGDALTSGTNNTCVGNLSCPTITNLTNVLGLGNGAAPSASNTGVIGNSSVTDVYFGSTAPSAKTHAASNEIDGNAFGANQINAPSACETNFGITTLSTGVATTNTGQNCLPANSVIDAVVYRITTTITTATSFTIGDSTTAARFCATQSTLTAGTTGICMVPWTSATAGTMGQTSAASVRVTASSTPGAGAIRLIVYYHTWTPPTS